MIMNRIFVLMVSLAFIMTACKSSRVVTTKDNAYKKTTEVRKTEEVVKKKSEVAIQAKEKPKTTHSKKSTVVLYIETYSAIAVREMNSYGVPASITLAQGILESGAGNGELTRKANNHFGIKCHGWEGEKVYHDDDKKGECFRKYEFASQSFEDHSLFLVNRKRYAKLFKLKRTDYKGWARGLKAAGYATDPKYPNKLISLIERYELYKYDKVDVVGPMDIVVNDTEEPSTNDGVFYKVKKGDTLYSIAKSVGLSVETLKALNQLEDNNIKIDQVLKIK